MFNPEKQFAKTDQEYASKKALPNSVKYSQLMPRAVHGRSSMRKFISNNNQSFTPSGNNVIEIDITSDAYSFLDGSNGFLEFTLQAGTIAGVGATNFQLNSGAWAVIKDLEIVSNNGIELEKITGYNLWHTKMFQYQTPSSQLSNHHDSTRLHTPNIVPNRPIEDECMIGLCSTQWKKSGGAHEEIQYCMMRCQIAHKQWC